MGDGLQGPPQQFVSAPEDATASLTNDQQLQLVRKFRCKKDLFQ